MLTAFKRFATSSLLSYNISVQHTQLAVIMLNNKSINVSLQFEDDQSFDSAKFAIYNITASKNSKVDPKLLIQSIKKIFTKKWDSREKINKVLVFFTCSYCYPKTDLKYLNENLPDIHTIAVSVGGSKEYFNNFGDVIITEDSSVLSFVLGDLENAIEKIIGKSIFLVLF